MGEPEVAALDRVAELRYSVHNAGTDCLPNGNGAVLPRKDFSKGASHPQQELLVGPHGDAETSCDLLTLPSIMKVCIVFTSRPLPCTLGSAAALQGVSAWRPPRHQHNVDYQRGLSVSVSCALLFVTARSASQSRHNFIL